MGRTCGEPDEIGLTAMGVELNGSRRVQGCVPVVGPRINLITNESGDIFRVGIFLDFVRRSGTTRAEGPHGGALHVRRAKRNRIDRHRGEVGRLVRRTAAAPRPPG